MLMEEIRRLLSLWIFRRLWPDNSLSQMSPAGRGGDLDGTGVPVQRGCRDGGCLVLGGVLLRDVS